ncbi:MAG: DUF4292 domain-containing protein [Bacteroidetes bacterium]|nr:DUF4292 domain-containing protein [Bacteroidota bacterium]
MFVRPFRPFRPALAALAVALVLGGCRTVQTVGGPAPSGVLPSNFGQHTLPDVLAHLADADTLTGLSGDGTLVIQSPQQSGTYDLSLAAASTGRASLTVSSFGIAGARALVRPDSVFVYNVLQRELLAADARRAADVLPVPVGPSDLFDLLTGTFRPADVATYALSVDRANGLYLLRSPDGRRVLAVDPRVWRVVRAVRYATSGGGVQEEVLWANYASSGSALLPRRLTVRQPGANTSVVLLLSGVRPDPAPAIPTRLNVPAGVSRRVL